MTLLTLDNADDYGQAAAAAGGGNAAAAGSGDNGGATSETPEDTNTLRYPLDDTDYKARVIFSLVSTESTGDAAGDAFSELIAKNQSDIDALKRQLDEIRSDIDSSDKTQAEFQAEIDEITAQIRGLQEQIKEYKGQQNQSAVGETIEVDGRQISLYLPAGLAFRDNVTYENFDLGAVGGAMEAGLGFAESMVKGVGSFVTGLTGGGGADVAKLAGVQLASKFGSFGAEAAAVQKLAGGVTLNPNTRVLFKQPNIREFAFAFKFVARSAKEADQVNQIVKFLRTELYPDEIKSVGGLSLGYKFPNKFNIQFEYDGAPIKGLAQIKPCYLRDVSTTYNASQMAMHSDGNFMEIDMTLSFQETAALTRKDIEAGY